MDDATQQANQTARLFNDYLAKGKILVRYALEIGHRSNRFQIEVVDLERKLADGEMYTGLIHLAYRGGNFGNSIQKQECSCQVYGPRKRRRMTAFEMFDIVTNEWRRRGDPVFFGGKCLWMEPISFVGCVRPRSDMKGLQTIFPASHPSWVSPFLCMFAGQFRSLVGLHNTVDTRLEFDMLEDFVGRFDSFFVNQCLYKAIGKPAS